MQQYSIIVEDRPTVLVTLQRENLVHKFSYGYEYLSKGLCLFIAIDR